MNRIILSLFFAGIFTIASAQEKAPNRKPDEGDGPHAQLIIRGVTLINGNGAPPIGPVDIVVEGNRITQVQTVGYPGVDINPNRRPKLQPGGKEYDCTGMYLLPGFVDMHGHIGGRGQGADAEYVFKLWMGHGITTIRDPSAGNGLDWVLDQKKRGEKNEIVAPRILAYTVFGQGAENGINTPEQAREWVRQNAKRGADGIKFFGARPDIMAAAIMLKWMWLDGMYSNQHARA
ncbi:MAG TPA: hypothetical protein PKE68_13295 [Saprospiraceae bacterium]|mgnify:FL=1|nr:hypothetical protein [Saprospiraceae bacterium]